MQVCGIKVNCMSAVVSVSREVLRDVYKAIVNPAEQTAVTFRMVNSVLLVSGVGIDDEIRIHSLDGSCVQHGKVGMPVNMKKLS